MERLGITIVQFTNLFFYFFQFPIYGHSFDKAFLQLTFDISNHSDVLYLSNTKPTILDKRYERYQISLHTKYFQRIPTQKLEGKFVIAVSYENVEETLTAIVQINNLTRHKNSRDFVILINWPSEMKKISEIEKLQTNERFQSAISQYTIEHLLFFVFWIKNEKHEIRFEKEKNIFYQVYTVNNIMIFTRLKNIGMTIVKTGKPDLKLRGLNVHGHLLRCIDQTENVILPHVSIVGNQSIQSVDGLRHGIFQILQETMNFTVEVVRPHQQFNTRKVNGSWTGVIRDVELRKIDLGFISSPMAPSITKQVSYLTPIQDNFLIALFQRLEGNFIRDIFMQPFQISLWVVILITWFVLAISITGFTYIRKRYGACNLDEPDLSGDSFIMILATATQQGWDEHPQAASLRTIFLFACVIGVIAYAGYSAAIVSTLSTHMDPIQTPTALLKSNLRIGIREGFRSWGPVPSLTNDIFDRIRSRLSPKESERYVNISYSLHLIHSEPFALICSSSNVYENMKSHLKDSEICNLKEIPILAQRFTEAMFTSKTFQFREVLRIMLTLLRERGVLWRLKTQFVFRRRCLEASDNSGTALGPNDVFTAFMILSGGYVFSLLFLMFEKLFYCKTLNFMQ